MVLGKYLPGKTAGIENYSHFLATLLLENNHQVDAAILSSAGMEPYAYEGVRVIPLKDGFDSFVSLLQEQHYDICHFQEYSGENGIHINWFTTAKQFCKKVFFTFHLPYLTCYKNDFRYFGIEDCNNFSSPERCIKCIIATKMNYKKSSGWNLHNTVIQLITPLIKRANTINQLRSRIQLRKNELEKLVETCDQVFIYADWFKQILNDNDYTSSSIKKIPYITKTALEIKEEKESAIKKKLLFVGRIEKQKGLHLLCKAMNLIDTRSVQLDVFGNKIDEEYFKNCEREYSFNFRGTLPLPELLQLLPDYDFLILPSMFTEMSSMIVKDAFKNHLPVIASAAKGNVEIIKEGMNGFIFEYDNYNDLARKIDSSYQLLSKGWQPSFSNEYNNEKDIQEIISFYA